ncbi:MAG TPA: ABC transporter permease [Kofleriaceae bacterium]|nr:ABC transporter permease [Kofleriaceae bacterium]
MSELWAYAVAHQDELVRQTVRHLYLVGVAMAVAVAIGLPLGVAVVRRPRARGVVLGFANIMQTVPSLALFGFLIPLPLIGGADARPAIIALMLYALLPIVKNTVTGIRTVPADVVEAANAMGLSRCQLLVRVELPLAMPVILAGIRIAVVISVGTATIAAAAGAEGLGVFIFRGLETYNNHATLTGAIPAAMMALGLDGLLAALERRLRVTRGAMW